MRGGISIKMYVTKISSEILLAENGDHSFVAASLMKKTYTWLFQIPGSTRASPTIP